MLCNSANKRESISFFSQISTDKKVTLSIKKTMCVINYNCLTRDSYIKRIYSKLWLASNNCGYYFISLPWISRNIVTMRNLCSRHEHSCCCTVGRCGPLPSQLHATPDKVVTTKGIVVTLTCDVGYRFTDDAGDTLTCDGSKWIGSLSNCSREFTFLNLCLSKISKISTVLNELQYLWLYNLLLGQVVNSILHVTSYNTSKMYSFSSLLIDIHNNSFLG